MNKNYIENLCDFDNVQEMMSYLFRILDGKPDIPSAQNMLHLIQERFKASRVYVVEYDWDRFEQNCVFEALAEGVSPVMSGFRNIPLEDTPWFLQRLTARKPVIINDITYLCDNEIVEHNFRSDEEISSFILLPIVTGETIVGFWGLDTETKNRHVWTEEDYHWLAAFSHVLTILGAFNNCSVPDREKKISRWELNKSRLNSIYNNIPVGVEIYDKDGYLVDYNDKDIEIFGITDKEDFIGKCIYNNPVIPKHLLERLRNKEDINLHLNYDFSKLGNYYKTHIKKGIKNLNIKGKCILNLQGEMDYFLFVISDNSKAERIYTEIQDFKNMFSVIARYSKIGYAKFNLTTQKGFAAGEWYRNLGEEENTPLPKVVGIYPHVHKDDRKRLQNFYSKAFIGKDRSFSGDIRVLCPDKTNKWLHKNIIIQERKDGTLEAVEINFDITYNKEVEEELISAREKAEESNKLKSAFLANMSHEIRTPLNAIVGFSNLLAETEDAEEKRDYLSIIENNNDLLLQLINDILDLSKIEAGTLEFNYSDVDINCVLQEIEYSSLMRQKNNDVLIEFAGHMPECVIRTDKNRMTQVLVNFINNAMKFTQKGSIKFGYRLQEDNTLYFYVTDTGSGIPSDKQEQIFGRFEKLDSQVQGTGLGLTISSTILDRLGGNIGVDSKLGKGSTFWFTLPYDPVFGAKECTNKPCEALKESVSKDKLTILIAEDNPSNYKLYETILGKEYILVHAWNGSEAVDLYKEYRPHLILMDIKMPVMDGYEATREIKKLSSSVPIIAVTAFAFEEDEDRILRCGFDSYTTKPVQIKLLKDKILNLLRKHTLIF